MAKFLKHIGKVGDRKIAVIFRQIPGDEHMALVVYTETLGSNLHDPMMASIESDQGQASENLGEALDRSYTKDGRQILQVLHREGMLKRVQTEQVIMTPTPNVKTHIRLNELNTMLTEMAKGEEAVKKLADLDASRGLQDPKDVARRVKENTKTKVPNQPPLVANEQGLLNDTDLAKNLQLQAIRMANEAKSLLAESDRLLKQASSMMGLPTEEPSKVTKSTRGRKAKAVVAE